MLVAIQNEEESPVDGPPAASQAVMDLPEVIAAGDLITHLPDATPQILEASLEGLQRRDWHGTTGRLVESEGSSRWRLELSVPLSQEEGELILSNLTLARLGDLAL